MITPKKFLIWSAAPTPLTENLTVDLESVERMVLAAIEGGVDGLFLGGTCGEGPWLPDRQRALLIKTAARTASGRLKIASQITDTSVPRILEQAHALAEAGGDVGLISPPPLMMNPTPERITRHFESAIDASPLPVGVYELGAARPFGIPADQIDRIYQRPNLVLVKDSSANPERRALALAARKNRPDLLLFNGDEFHAVDYLEAGYDGLMLGGAVASLPYLHRISDFVSDGQWDEARSVEQEMIAFLYGIYGGESIACWLTGLKTYLVKRGLFTTSHSFLEYPLTSECLAFIDEAAARMPPAGHATAK